MGCFSTFGLPSGSNLRFALAVEAQNGPAIPKYYAPVAFLLAKRTKIVL